jgi:hypothetical protein
MIALSINNNKTLVATSLFLVFFIYINVLKPGFLYNKDGSLREFGIGYKSKTVMPLWIISIMVGLLSYLLVLGYIKFGLKISF